MDKQIGQRLREMRLKAKLSQAKVAAVVGSRQSAVARFESGDRHFAVLISLGKDSNAVYFIRRKHFLIGVEDLVNLEFFHIIFRSVTELVANRHVFTCRVILKQRHEIASKLTATNKADSDFFFH